MQVRINKPVGIMKNEWDQICTLYIHQDILVSDYKDAQ